MLRRGRGGSERRNFCRRSDGDTRSLAALCGSSRAGAQRGGSGGAEEVEGRGEEEEGSPFYRRDEELVLARCGAAPENGGQEEGQSGKSTGRSRARGRGTAPDDGRRGRTRRSGQGRSTDGRVTSASSTGSSCGDRTPHWRWARRGGGLGGFWRGSGCNGVREEELGGAGRRAGVV